MPASHEFFQGVDKVGKLNIYKIYLTLILKYDQDIVRKKNYRQISEVNVDAEILYKTLAN